ncbi:MAG: tellurium resistance protein TerD [Frankiales bacterium]|jgi:tellurium resistance protein TerD|nr:tellurium resistance protein TerD [Frankiales bacterium]
MADMRRGANVALTREIRGLSGVVLGVRLNAGAEQILADNLVVATLLCNADSKVLSDEHFVFFNQLTSPDLSVSQLDTALGEDSEQIEVDLGSVPPEVSRIAVIAYINQAIAAKRTLGQLRDATIRVLNLQGNAELVRSENLAPALSSETALVLGELYRNGPDWKFKVIGEGYAQGIAGIARDYGVAL